MDEKSMTPKHRDVVVKLRERIEQYRRRHSDCQSKQERSLAVIEDQERQEALALHKRVLESRNTKLLNKIKQQEITKIEHPSNGLDRELKSTNAILQQQIILKRKHDQGINNLHMNCDGENGQIGESLSKYSRSDDINNPLAASSHEHQISMQQSADQQQSNPASQSDSMNNPKTTTLVGNNGHFVGDTSRSSPLLAPSGTHTSEAFQNANRVSSPNSLPPTEFKQDPSHSVAVTSDGGRANGIALNNSTRSNTETKTADSVAGQDELQQQLNDFERVLLSITNSDMYTNTAMNPDMSSQHLQLSTRTSAQIDAVTRDSLNPQQQNPNVQNPSTGQQNPYPPPPTQGPPGPTALHLQQLARQAQSQRAQANSGYLEGQEQDNQRFRSPQMQIMDAIRFAVSGTQQQLQSQTSMQPAQFSTSSRFRGSMATTSEQYANMYSTKDQNHNVIMSTGFPSNSTMSLQYQRMMQTQAVAQQQQQQQQQALYSRMGQQGMGQRLSHPSIPEHQQSSYPPYQPHQNMPQSQYSGMPMQSLPAYSNSGFQNIRSNQPPFTRQLSMPTPQGYQEQYPINQYTMGDQQVPSQQQTDLSSTSYHNYNRRNSFPLYHRSVSQPVANYGPTGPHPGGAHSGGPHPGGSHPGGSHPGGSHPGGSHPGGPHTGGSHPGGSHPGGSHPGGSHLGGPHPGGPHSGYQQSVNQMRNNIPAANSASAAMIDGRNHPQSAGYNYSSQTSFSSQSGLQGLMQLPQRNGPAMSQTGSMQPRTDQRNMQGYAATNMRDTASAANLSQDMKYSARNDVAKNTRAPTFSDPLSLTDATTTSSSDSHFNPFSPLGSLEKAPSFASLLEQSSGALNNLETTYTGSIPNLDLLGEIIG